MKKFYVVLVLTLFLFSCAHEEKQKKQSNQSKKAEVEMPKMSLKIHSRKSTIGIPLEMSILVKNNIKPDSIYFFINNKKVFTSDTSDTSYIWQTKDAHTGTQYIQVNSYYKGAFTISSSTCILFSDIIPKEHSYRIIEKLPHDREAYTQGFYFEKGFFYEATGLKGESSLRKVVPQTGEVINSFTIPATIFGEGITAFHDKIIQLSWQSRVGFVYDKKSFKLLHQFNYSTEGWGITTDSSALIMSDGTNYIYFLDPNTFSIIRSIEVYDNKSPVTKLNELEYIDGKIWANIYMTDKVAIIEPKTGKVDAYIDFSKLLDPKLRQPDTDVLNGIAYDNVTKHIWVTGKKWPLIYRVVIL